MKKNSLFGSVASAMLLCVFALTSCVQDDMYEMYDDGFESGFVRMKKGKDMGGPSTNNAQTFMAAAAATGSFPESNFTVTTCDAIVGMCTEWTNTHTKPNTNYHLECVGLKFADNSALMYVDPYADVIETDNGIEWTVNVPVCWSCPVQPTEVLHTHPGGSSDLSDEDEDWLKCQRERRNPKLKLTVIPIN